MCARRLFRSNISRAGTNPRFKTSFFTQSLSFLNLLSKSTFHPRISSTFVPSISLTICARFRRGGGVGEDRVRRLVVRQEGAAPLDRGMVRKDFLSIGGCPYPKSYNFGASEYHPLPPPCYNVGAGASPRLRGGPAASDPLAGSPTTCTCFYKSISR